MSIESGIYNLFGKWMITNIAIIEDDCNIESCGTSPSFPVPDKFVEEIIDKDLSTVINNIYGKDNEIDNKLGGIQLLTHGVISRIDLTEQVFTMCLTKYINCDNWK